MCNRLGGTCVARQPYRPALPSLITTRSPSGIYVWALEAANAARRAVQSSPGFSVARCLLAAALAKLGRTEDAKAAAVRVLALQPSFSSSGICGAIGIAPALVEALTEAWREAGLPP